MQENHAEIYRQRYETFRHLDKLRWQMLQLLVAVATTTALVLGSTTVAIQWWFYSLLGFSLIVISAVMLKIGAAIRKNSETLKNSAIIIGDQGIPDVSNKWKSVTYWLAIFVIFFGGWLIIISLLSICSIGNF